MKRAINCRRNVVGAPSPNVLVEEYAFLREQGQSDAQIAARFGIRVDSLHQAVERARERA